MTTNKIDINPRYNEVSFKEVLESRYMDKDNGWTDMSEVVRNDLAMKFKAFLLSKSRKGSSIYHDIQHTSLLECKPYTLYERLVYNSLSNEVEFITGQSNSDEMKALKQAILK